jgi:hypothetical protein
VYAVIGEGYVEVIVGLRYDEIGCIFVPEQGEGDKRPRRIKEVSSKPNSDD